MSIYAMTRVWKYAPYSENTLLTALALADWADDDGVCFPGMKQIAQKSRQSERNAQYCIHRIMADGYLTLLECGGGRGKRPKYQLNLAKFAPISETKGAIGDIKRVQPATTKGAIGDIAIRKEPSVTVKEPSYPSWLPKQEWVDYKAMRIRIRKPMTLRAEELALGKLDSLRSDGHEPKEVLEQSTFNSWQGLFEIRRNGHANGNSNGKISGQQCHDAIDAAAAKMAQRLAK